MKRESKNSKLTAEDIQRYTRNFWKILLGIIGFGLLFIFLVRIGLFGSLPGFDELENPQSNLASEILADDNRILGTYYKENRSNVEYKDLSPYLVNRSEEHTSELQSR